jgi:hypothetical protein
MQALSARYQEARAQRPEADLCVVFDIDGTILDMRFLIAHVLLGYDRANATDHFRGLTASDIHRHEDDVAQILADVGVDRRLRPHIVDFYRAHLWDRSSLVAASRPFEGVLGVIRWFQLQPKTHVAVNTGRPERSRADTVESLHAIGAAHRVRFDPSLITMAPPGLAVTDAKVEGIDGLRRRGLEIVAVVDNEPENLTAMAAADRAGTILFLHADTIYRSQSRGAPRAIGGRRYVLADLVPRTALHERVQLVWHGVNDPVNLRRFLGADVSWAEIDVRTDPIGRLVLRHDAFDVAPWSRAEGSDPLTAADAVRELAMAGRSVKCDVKEGGDTMRAIVRVVGGAGLDDRRLWFNAEIDAVGPAGFTWVRRRHPAATISCPVDFIVPLLRADPPAAHAVLATIRSWGVTRLSVRWPVALQLLPRLEELGWEVNVYGVPDLEAFLEAMLLLPTSITADFNFPAWGYHGRGSGEGGLQPSREPRAARRVRARGRRHRLLRRWPADQPGSSVSVGTGSLRSPSTVPRS